MVVVSSYGYKSNGNVVLGMKDNQHYDQFYLLTVTSRWKNPDNHKTPYEQANIAFIFFFAIFAPLSTENGVEYIFICIVEYNNIKCGRSFWERKNEASAEVA